MQRTSDDENYLGLGQHRSVSASIREFLDRELKGRGTRWYLVDGIMLGWRVVSNTPVNQEEDEGQQQQFREDGMTGLLEWVRH